MNTKFRPLIKKILIFGIGIIGLSLLSIFWVALGFNEWIYTTFSPLQASKNINSLFTLIVYLTGLLCLFLILGRDIFVSIASEFKISKNIKDGVAIGIIILSFTLLYNIIINQIIPTGSNQNESSVEAMTLQNPLFSTISIVFIAPIFEELVYRYGLFGLLKSTNRFLAYAGTILIFAFIHFNFSTEPSELLNEVLNLPSYLFAAGILSYAYDKNGLACSIVAHAFNNLFAVITTFF